MSPGTVNFAFGVVRTLFRVNELEWPYRRGEAPRVGQRDIYKPSLSPELVKRMIKAAKNGTMDTTPACFLALSTIYGLRREEMCTLTPADVNLEKRMLYVSTAKFGRERYHLIPAEIIPYLERHDFSCRYSLLQMSQIFWMVVTMTGLDVLKPKRLGWHSLRRSVVKMLYDAGLNPQLIHYFMRWKGATPEFAMDARYYATTEVGLEGETVVTEEARSDEEVFGKHRFLSWWRG